MAIRTKKPKDIYGYEEITETPNNMTPWRAVVTPPHTDAKYGSYVLVAMEQSSKEDSLQVEVINENGVGLRGVWIVVGCPGRGPDIPVLVIDSFWEECPYSQLTDKEVYQTGTSGYINHTIDSGGETVFILDVDDKGTVWMSSTIVSNCHYVRPPLAHFRKTGLKLVFQRRKTGYLSNRHRFEEVEDRISKLELIAADLEAKVRNLQSYLDHSEPKESEWSLPQAE